MKTDYGNYAEWSRDFDRRQIALEHEIGNRLVSIVLFSMSNNHDAADTLDRIVEERGNIMAEVRECFGIKK